MFPRHIYISRVAQMDSATAEPVAMPITYIAWTVKGSVVPLYMATYLIHDVNRGMFPGCSE